MNRKRKIGLLLTGFFVGIVMTGIGFFSNSISADEPFVESGVATQKEAQETINFFFKVTGGILVVGTSLGAFLIL